jgi:membrane protein implicated in regulation of membrane protease activity
VLTLIALVVALLFLSSPWSVILVASAVLIDLGETGAFVWWSRRRRRLVPAAVGIEAVMGQRGVVLTRLGSEGDPPGQIRIGGEIWAACAAEPIDPGELVTVTSVEGLELGVERDPGT